MRQLTIRNFRGIQELDLDLVDHTVLIGENNAGKTAIPQALLYGIVYPQVTRKTLGTPVSRIYLTQVKAAMLSAVVSLPTALFMRSWLAPTGWLEFFANVAVILAAGAATAYFIIDSDDKERVRSLFKKAQ
ncbi:MAG: AAA family ATPase [Candidatus Zixiibacteriota bacterium]